MRKITLFLVAILLMVSTAPTVAQVNNTAVMTSMQWYFNLLTRGQYADAYSYLRTGENFFDYVAGFSNTEWIQPYFGIPQSNGTDIRVPMTLVSHQKDETKQTFFGCIFVQDEGTNAYGIIGNNLTLMSFIDEPSVGSVAHAVNNLNCYETPTIFPNQAPRGIGEAGIVLRQYFDSVQDRNYDAAYAMWLSPIPFPQPNGMPATDYRPNFVSFIEGYLTTRTITVYTGSLGEYQGTGAAAGKPYLDGLQRIVLVSEDASGVVTTYSGCYVMGRFFDGRVGIVNGQLNVIATVPTAQQINDALNIDCIALGIPN